MKTASIETLIVDIAQRARTASLQLATLKTETKNQFLNHLADALIKESEAILEANAKDLVAAKTDGLSVPMTERLAFDPVKIEKMAEGVRQVAALPDPVGEEIERLNPPRGFDLRKRRVPMGVIGIIYESRPNVTVDAAALCLISGNAAILRGGSDSYFTSSLLASLMVQGLESADLPAANVQMIPSADRALVGAMVAAAG